MDDFVQVQQIAGYPLITQLLPADTFLIQRGFGGGYYSIQPGNLFTGISNISVGLFPAPTAQGITATFLLTPLGARQGFNWYVDLSGVQRYLQNGVAGQWSMDNGALTFSIAPTGFKDGPVWPFTTLFALGYDGELELYQQLKVGRDPVLDNEVATLGFISRNTVTSFNGRTGPVALGPLDINAALGLEPTDLVASQSWVNCAIGGALNELYVTQPFVFTFNGRVGDICLLATDVSAALFADPLNATAPSPTLGDASNRIATTMFTDESLQDLHDQITQEIADSIGSIIDLSQYALLNSPQFTGIPTAPTANPGTSTGQLATTAFVQAAVVASTTGVSTWNGRTGAVVLTAGDITTAGGALLASPVFVGTPQGPTAAPGTSNAELATTAFVGAAIAAIPAAAVTSFNSRTGAIVLTTGDITGAGGAPTVSPAFSGSPTAPTAAPGTSTTAIATTAFVQAAITALGAGVASFNGRTGAVTLQAADVSAVGGALVASPTFTGVPAAPTASPGTSTTQLATCAFVAAAISAGVAGVSSFNGRSGVVTLTLGDVTGAGGAPLASPALTGAPTAPTAAQTSNDGTLATTQFVHAAIAAAPTGVTSFNTRTGSVTLSGADVSAAGGALSASPTFTGTPLAPTAAPGTNTQQLATTAFVAAAIIAGAGVTTFNTRAGAVTLTLADITGAGGAPLANPALTGVPTAPTATAGTNTTQIASTAFVEAAVTASAAGAINYSAQAFTTAGTATFTTAGNSTTATVYRIRMVGGGGGGGGAGSTAAVGAGGGGSGEFKEFLLTGLAASTAVPLVIGAAGTAGTTTGAGGAGGAGTATTMTVASQAIVCDFGRGGAGGSATAGGTTNGGAGGAGGATPAITGLTLMLDIPGQYGANDGGYGGAGGSNPLGFGGVQWGTGGNATAGLGYGSGGPGSQFASSAGKAGAGGAVIVERVAG